MISVEDERALSYDILTFLCVYAIQNDLCGHILVGF